MPRSNQMIHARPVVMRVLALSKNPEHQRAMKEKQLAYLEKSLFRVGRDLVHFVKDYLRIQKLIRNLKKEL